MTDVTRFFVCDLDKDDENERGLPCVVHHPDAGGRCHEPASVRMYDVLNFCEAHGEEAKVGALMEASLDAGYFFDRFRNPHVPDLNPIIDSALRSWSMHLNEKGPSDEDHYRALRRAYPNPPKYVREIILQWERDEGDEGPYPVDLLLDSLGTLNKLMRHAHADAEDWLTELLEYQRQECAARAAYALEVNDRRAFAAEKRRREDRPAE